MRSFATILPAIFAASALAAPVKEADDCEKSSTVASYGSHSTQPPSYGGSDNNNGHGGYGSRESSVAHQTHSSVSVPTLSPSSSLQQIQLVAQGTLPDSPLPTKLSNTTQIILEIIATTELFESAFFSELIANISTNKPGYEIEHNRDIVLRDLTAIFAQEQLHAIGANALLQTAGYQPILPCKYDFAANSYKEALSFITLQTDVVLGTLQEVLAAFAADGDQALIPLVGSIVGQEGEQNGWFRSRLSKIPSALPFLTTASGAFAYSAINQNGIIAGSCPNGTAIAAAGIPIFKPLTLNTKVDASTTQIEYSVTGTLPAGASIVYINQQNTPKTVKISNIKSEAGKTTFTAPFPYTQNLMNGLTIAAVVNGSGNFTSAGAVAQATLFGPGLIEIN